MGLCSAAIETERCSMRENISREDDDDSIGQAKARAVGIQSVPLSSFGT